MRLRKKEPRTEKTMTTTETEVLAGLRVLVCIAKADGVLHEEEEKALAAALEASPLPEGITLDGLLGEDTKLEDELAHIVREELRREVFQSAYSMAHADGDCSAEEQSLLDQIHGAFGLWKDDTTARQGLFHARDTRPTASS